MAKAVVPVHKVYAAALEYKNFLDSGTPITFDVPSQPGTVISGLKLGKQILLRRTDFEENKEPVSIKVGDATLSVPAVTGACQVLDLP